MNHANHPMVVKRGGFLSATAHGFFGLLTAVVVCSAGVGVYALHVVDTKLETVLGLGSNALYSLPESLPEIRKSLPPALADALNDERSPEYRDQVEVEVSIAPGLRHDSQQLVLTARNNGDKTITLMAVRVVLVDEKNVPVSSIVTYAATPLTIDHDWRGPILPGSTRKCSEPIWRGKAGLTPHLEITDLRVWTGPVATAVEMATPGSPLPPVSTD